VTTAIAVGTLYVGAWRAEADFVPSWVRASGPDLGERCSSGPGATTASADCLSKLTSCKESEFFLLESPDGVARPQPRTTTQGRRIMQMQKQWVK